MENIAIYLKFYANCYHSGDYNKYFCFKMSSVESLSSMMSRFEHRGFCFLSAWIEGRINGNVMFNFQVLKRKNFQIEYFFDNIKKCKIFESKLLKHIMKSVN